MRLRSQHRKIANVVAAATVFLAVFLATAPSSFAAVKTVCSSGCDATTVQAGINAASAGDEVRIIDSRQYNESVIVNKGGINLTSNQTFASVPTIFSQNTSFPSVTVSSDNVTIQNLIIIYNGTGSGFGSDVDSQGFKNTTVINNTLSTRSRAGGTYNVFFSKTNSSNITQNIITTNAVSFGTSTPISMQFCSNNTITGNILSTNGTTGNYGIYLQTKATNNNITNNTIRTNGTQDVNYGIWIADRSNNNTVTGNFIFTNGTSNNFGFTIAQSNFTIFMNNTISTGGSSDSNYGVETDTRASSTNVTNNTIFTTGTNTNAGIYFQTGGNNTAASNIVSTNGITGGSNYGIVFDQQKNSSALSNIVSTNGSFSSGASDYGIYLTNTNISNVTGNTVSTNGRGSNYGSFMTSSDNNTYINNSFSAFGNGAGNNFGIRLQNSNQSIMINNNFSANGTFANSVGVYMDAGSSFNNITVSNVTTYDTGTGGDWGILVQSSPNNLFSNVTVTTLKGTDSYGVRFDAGSYNNTFKDSVINAVSAFDIYNFVTNQGDDNHFINTTFNKTDIGFQAGSLGKIFVEWRLSARVIDAASIPLPVANVFGNDTNSVANIENPKSNFTSTTDSSGFIAQQVLAEFLANVTYNSSTGGTGYLYFTNYTVNASFSGYTVNSTSVNLTSGSSLTIMLIYNTTLPLSSCWNSTRISKLYICSYDSTEFANGKASGLLYSGDSSKFSDLCEQGNGDYYKFNITSNGLMKAILPFATGTCAKIGNKTNQIVSQGIPSSPFGTYDLSGPSYYQARLQYDRIRISGDLRIGSGANQVCFKKIGQDGPTILINITNC